MRPKPTTDPDSFFTRCSLSHPVTEDTHCVGGYLVRIWAQTQEALGLATGWLNEAYEQSNSAEIRVIVKSVVDHAERRAVPLACHIWGKSDWGL